MAEQNALKERISIALEKNDNNWAIAQYEQLLANSIFIEPEIRYNLSVLYQQKGDLKKAKKHFSLLIKNRNKELSSISYFQLGQIAIFEKDTNQALLDYRKSIQINNENQIACYNYELLKKSYNPLNNKASPNQDQQQTEVEKSEIKEQNLKKNIIDSLSEEKALQILDAMRNQEIQYIQQRRR